MRSLRFFLCPFVFVISFFAALPGHAQTPGENVNMVSGTKWPGGDPFLQRQNEPSLAVSTRNSIHLLAGANDYRSVDIPNSNSPDERGDAWLGVFKSFDGGATWGSTLLPGYPQDTSAVGMSSPLHGFTTAADPVVRAGTNGLFYYTGIAFDRGTNLGVVFIARFMDLNNQEGGDASQSMDPIRYVSAATVDSGTSGQFLDKPWVAVDVPRGTASCTMQVPQGTTTVQQIVPAGNVYMVWTRFTGGTGTAASTIYFARSQDCGATWTHPFKLNQDNFSNQGAALEVDPKTGNIYVIWRRFANTGASDAIVSVASTNFGQSFSSPVDILDLPAYSSTSPNAPSFFDQDTSSAAFRIHAFPSLEVDGNGTVYAAWSQRGLATGGDARIAMVTSTNGVNWGAPFAIDNGPLTENGQPILDSSGNQLVRGHQVMPQITVNAGQLFVLYYDLREDHTTSLFPPNAPFGPDANGNFFQEKRQLQGELATSGNSGQVFTPFLTDANLTTRRHTLDLVVAQADTNKFPLAFNTARVSRYKFGLRNDGKDIIGPDGFPILQQLQEDPPNLPLFQQGTVPFMGDYVDIAGVNFVPTDASGQHWAFNTSPANIPVVYAAWTSNQDVVPPADGDWTHYTPVGGGGPSVFSSGTTTPACSTGQQGMRNQNIYMSRITQGLVLSSPQNYKPLNTTFQRGFGIFVQNFTNSDKSFQLTIGNQPAGGWASFVSAQGNPLPPANSFVPTATLTVAVPAHSGIGRMVFATSTTPASSIQVNAAELVSGGTTVKAGGLSSFVTLNPDSTAPALLNPPGNTAGDISNTEIFNGSLVNVGVTDPNIDGSLVNSSYVYGSLVNGSLVNADVNSGSLVNGSLVNGSLVNGSLVNGSLVNGSLVNGSLVNGSLVNTDLATFGVASGSLLNTTLANGSLVNGSLVNGSLVNGSLVNGSLVNAPVSDLSYTFTHNGNTAGTYTIGLIGNPTTPPNLQLIVTKTYFTTTSVGCTLAQEPHNVVLSNVNSPTILDPTTTNPSDPAITDTSADRSTVVLGPGETAVITLRGVNLSPTSLHGLTTQLGPLVTSQACNTSDPQHCGVSFFAAPLLITSATPTVPAGKVGALYSATLTNIGGVAPFGWTITLGTLPNGLTLSSAGLLSGTPTTAGTFSFTASLVDSSSPQNSTTRALTVTVGLGDTATGLSASSMSLVYGQQVTLTATVGASTGAPTGSVIFSDGQTTLGTVPLTGAVASFSTSSLTPGMHSITSSYSGDSNYSASSSSAVQLNVSQATTTTTITTSPGTPVFGQPLTVTASVSVSSPGAGTPTGTVNFTDGSTPIGSTSLSGGQGSITISTLSAGNHSFNATFSGDTNFTGSSPAAAFSQMIAQAPATLSLSGLTATYDGTPKSVNATTTPAGLSVSFTYDNSPTPPTNAGNHAVAAKVTDPNYTGTATGTLVISQAAASVTPNAAGKVYGMVDPALTGTLSGFLPADGVTAMYSRNPGESAGTYTISATLSPAGVLGNYNITSSTAVFTINKATASVTPNAAGKVYGMADPALTGTLSGFLPADGVTAMYTRTPGETVVGSPYTISATLSPAAVLGNYSILSNTASFTITRATAIVTLGNMSQAYTGSPLSPTVTTVPANLAFTLTGAPDTNAGSYPVTATVNDPNYAGSASGTFVITRPGATVSPSSVNFGIVSVGTTVSQTVTLTNTGNAALTITSIKLSGLSGDNDEFGFVNHCSSTLAAGAFCTIKVTYTADRDDYPAVTATLVITDNAPGSPQSVALKGEKK